MWPEFDSRTRVISALSLLVLYSAPRGFSPGTPIIFPSPQKPTFDLIRVELSCVDLNCFDLIRKGI